MPEVKNRYMVHNALFRRVSYLLKKLVFSHLSDGVRFIYIGFLEEEKTDILDFFNRELGLRINAIEFEEEWGALSLGRSSKQVTNRRIKLAEHAIRVWLKIDFDEFSEFVWEEI